MALAQRAIAAPGTQHTDYDVAIVGAGIAGLTLACALQPAGLRIALIEANPLTAVGLIHSKQRKTRPLIPSFEWFPVANGRIELPVFLSRE
jgi:glycine/D-amino acid oxidase-like deaminating enzyme